MKMNLIERERLKTHLNNTLNDWLEEAHSEFLLPETTDNTAAYMATAAINVLDALEDVENDAREREGGSKQ